MLEVTAAGLGWTGWLRTLWRTGWSVGLLLLSGWFASCMLLLLLAGCSGLWLLSLWATSFSGSLFFGPAGGGHIFMTASTAPLSAWTAGAQKLWEIRNVLWGSVHAQMTVLLNVPVRLAPVFSMDARGGQQISVCSPSCCAGRGGSSWVLVEE